MEKDEIDKLNELIDEILTPEYLAKNLTKEEFYEWCRSPYLALEKSSKLFDYHLKRFEDAELYEHCIMIKKAKKEFENGTIKIN